MKKITVNHQEIALVYKNERLKQVLNEGVYRFFFGEKVCIYNIHEQLPETSVCFFESEHLKEHLNIIEVGDEELVLKFEKGNFKEILAPGIYAFWKKSSLFHFQKVSTSDYIIDGVSRTILEKAALSSFVRKYSIETFEKAVFFVDGQYMGILEPGNYFWWKNPQIIMLAKGDTRQQNLEISGQEILTKDKVQLRLNFAVQYQITDFEQAFIATKDFEKHLYLLLQFTLRNLIGTLTFDELMDQKNKIAHRVYEQISDKAGRFGVSIIDTGLKDIILPGEVRDIMNQVLVAEKKAQANSIMRREETASTRSLLNTARLMEENQMLYKLKEMEYIEKIAEKINSVSVTGNGNIVSELKQIFTR